MSKMPATINDYRLVKAHLDWQNVRIQMVVGMIAIFCLCLVNFWAAMQLNIPENSHLFFSGGLLPGRALMVFRFINFALYFAACLLTALITLEITGRFGNRLGASSALWSSLLFCILPWQVYFCMPERTFNRAIIIAILLVGYLWLHARKKVNWLILPIAIVLGLGTYALFDRSVLMDNNDLIIHAYILFSPTFNTLLFVTYFISGLNCLLKFKLGLLSGTSLRTIAIGVISIFVLANLSIIPDWIIPNHWRLEANGLILASAILAITLSLTCLPAIDKGRIYITRACGLVGLIILVTFAITYEKLFTSLASNELGEAIHSKYSDFYK